MNPLVCAICLTADRHQMTDRAVQCFLAQTYDNKHLLIYDTGKKPYRLDRLASSCITLVCDGPEMAGTIGALRNRANALAPPGTEILAHWDSDDWSNQYRLQDQVVCLNVYDKDCVGYGEMLFWDSRPTGRIVEILGEAWVYTGDSYHMIGTSLCYWRKTWEAKLFRETSAGEDHHFQEGIKRFAFPSLLSSGPVMIAEIHGKNTCAKIDPANKKHWRRAIEYDKLAAEIMKL